MLPPDTPKDIVKGKLLPNYNSNTEAIVYIREIYPVIKEKYNLKDLIFIQCPGDLVFVPGGWWHVVVNLTDSIAVTQNYCNSINFEYVWKKVRTERKKMAVKMLRMLELNNFEIYKKAIELNEKDNYIMYDKRKFVGRKRRTDSYDSDSSSSSSSSLSENSLIN